MKRYSIFVFLFAIVSVVSAQERDSSYQQILREFYDACPISISLKGKVAVATIVAEAEVEKAEKEGGIVTKRTAKPYMEEVYGDELLMKDLQPLFEKYVTDSELRQLVDSLSSPRGKAFVEHIDKVFTESYPEEYAKALSKAIVAYKLKNEMPDYPLQLTSVQPAAGIKKPYRKQFVQFYDAKDLMYSFKGEVMNWTMAAMRRELLKENGIYIGGSLMKRTTEYIEKNYCNIAMNACHGTLTLDDISFALSLASLPAYEKIVNAMNEFDATSDSVSQNARLRYTEWLKKTGVIES